MKNEKCKMPNDKAMGYVWLWLGAIVLLVVTFTVNAQPAPQPATQPATAPARLTIELLPPAAKGQPAAKIQTHPVTRQDLTNILLLSRSKEPGLIVDIQGPGDLPFESLAPVLDACALARVPEVTLIADAQRIAYVPPPVAPTRPRTADEAQSTIIHVALEVRSGKTNFSALGKQTSDPDKGLADILAAGAARLPAEAIVLIQPAADVPYRDVLAACRTGAQAKIGTVQIEPLKQ